MKFVVHTRGGTARVESGPLTGRSNTDRPVKISVLSIQYHIRVFNDYFTVIFNLRRSSLAPKSLVNLVVLKVIPKRSMAKIYTLPKYMTLDCYQIVLNYY